jgi:uncharacterized membrane protein YgcG
MRQPLLAASATLLTLTAAAFGDAGTRAALAKRQPAIDLKDIALVDALDFVRDTTGANLVIDWPALEQVGVSKDMPVSLKLRNVPLRVVLKNLLDAASPGLLTYYVEGNVVNVTTLAKADEKQVTILYPVQDLLVEIPDFAGPSLNLTESQGGTNGGRKGGNSSSGSGGGLFGGGNGGTDKNNDKGKTKAERAQDLVDLIQSTIRPDVWDTNGGKARIKYFNGNLVITAPRSVHELIGGPVD